MRNIWKNLAAATAVCAVFAGAPAFAADSEPPKPDGQVADLKITDKDYSIGPKDAKVVIVEYASLTCPHCANFHTKEMPPIKKEFVETGKVRFVYRDFPLDRVALPAAMMARCVDEKRYPGVISVLFKTQNSWATARDPIGELGKIAALAGLGKEAFESCLQSEELANGVLTSRQEGTAAGVNSTPTFMVNGKIYAGAHSIEDFTEILDPMLK